MPGRNRLSVLATGGGLSVLSTGIMIDAQYLRQVSVIHNGFTWYLGPIGIHDIYVWFVRDPQYLSLVSMINSISVWY